MTTRDDVLRAAKTAGAARLRAEKVLERAVIAEECAIQDAANVLGARERGTASVIAHEVSRTPEHVRKVIDPKQQRGHYRPTS